MSYSIGQGLVGRLRRSTEQYVRDLEALGPEAVAKSPGGKARTPLHFTAEVGFYNKLAAEQVRTGKSPSMGGEEEREKAFNSIQSLEQAIGHLRESTEMLVAEIERRSDDELTEIIDTFLGPIPMCEYLAVIEAHIQYHDGQLNYLQAINGDDTFHFSK